MSHDYTVYLTITPPTGAPLSIVTGRGDVPAALPVVLDGLAVGWSFPDADAWPVPIETFGSFSILAESAAAVADVVRGSLARITIMAGCVDANGDEWAPVDYIGRVSNLTGSPINATHPATGLPAELWQLDVALVDLAVDLAETPFPVNALPVAPPAGDWGTGTNGENTVAAGIAARFKQAGLAAPVWGDAAVAWGPFCWDAYSPNPAWAYFYHTEPDAVRAQASTLADAIAPILAAFADQGAGAPDGGLDTGDPNLYAGYRLWGFRRGIVVPNRAWPFGNLAANPWRLEWVSRRYASYDAVVGSLLPGRFAEISPGVYGVELVPADGAPGSGGVGLSADYLDRDASWTYDKGVDPNTVTVPRTVPQGSLTPEGVDTFWTRGPVAGVVAVSAAAAGEAVVSADLAGHRLADPVHAEWAGEMYTEGNTIDRPWRAAGFRWFASTDPAWPVNRSLFPFSNLFGSFSDPVFIGDIPATQLPSGGTFYAGTLRGATWRFSGGEFSIDFELYPRLGEAIPGGAGFTWSTLAAEYPAVTWNDLEPSQTWLEYAAADDTLTATP